MDRRNVIKGEGAGRKPIKPSLYVVTPTFNEAQNVAPLAAALFALPIANLHVVVVDDNSPDGTGQVAEQLSCRYWPRLHVIHRPGKQGLGPAYRQGFQYALERRADFIVQMDADLSHSPSCIPHFLEHVDRYDVIVGSRYVSGGQLDPSWSRLRYGLSVWANSIYVRTILRLQVHDATSGFKLWSSQALGAVLQYPLRSVGFFFQVEMAFLTERLGFCVFEQPIYFQDRQHGFSKMSGAIKLEAAWQTLCLRWYYRSLRAPSYRPETGQANRYVVRNRPISGEGGLS